MCKFTLESNNTILRTGEISKINLRIVIIFATVSLQLSLFRRMLSFVWINYTFYVKLYKIIDLNLIFESIQITFSKFDRFTFGG